MKNKRFIVAALCFVLVLGAFTGCGGQKTMSAGEMLYGAATFGEQMEPIVSDASTMYSDYVAFKITDEEFKERAQGLSDRITPILSDFEKFKGDYAVTGADEVYTTAMKGMGNAITLAKALVDQPSKNEINQRQDYLDYYVEMMNLINENLDAYKVCAAQVGEESK